MNPQDEERTLEAAEEGKEDSALDANVSQVVYVFVTSTANEDM